ncbi:MAG TPA: pyruvoyl-dependent arginine decarboxylase [Patescibacteria group bacterium]|nr:pyruvoyl-dependent arginine decarboxylase [Patescibacteria group bacterium]
MKITITSGTGTGSTLLSAFDDALKNCGVSNYNLIYLSSVIPPSSEIVKDKYITPQNEYGDRLYVVRAEHRGGMPGEWIGAALGWYQRKDNGGIFVEYDAVGKTKQEVESKLRFDVTHSVKDLCRFRNYPCTDGDIHVEMELAKVTDKPTCVLVLAVYKSEKW